MTAEQRTQATLILREVPEVERLRASLDPAMARGVSAHVTAIYEDEAPDRALLGDRLRMVCRDIGPVELLLGRIVEFAPPDEGLYVETTVSDRLARLRGAVLQPPFAPRRLDFRAHVTVLHPRNAAVCSTDWRAYGGTEIGQVVTVSEVSVIGLRAGSWEVLETIQLKGR